VKYLVKAVLDSDAPNYQALLEEIQRREQMVALAVIEITPEEAAQLLETQVFDDQQLLSDGKTLREAIQEHRGISASRG
jgi:hypothetical protein